MVLQTIDIPQLLLNTVIDVPVAPVVQDIPVVVQRLIPMVSLTWRFPIALRHVGLCPWCAGRASSTGAVVKETVVPPQLHLSETRCVQLIVTVMS